MRMISRRGPEMGGHDDDPDEVGDHEKTLTQPVARPLNRLEWYRSVTICAQNQSNPAATTIVILGLVRATRLPGEKERNSGYEDQLVPSLSL